ncbi:hypothetical protein GH714_008642 [Hevea brasiliensis]|uniref:Major facilitator superfamily (MFS) profile domain-containing protein n=1 Tax=Hevea brasiliensis TaxID=3981 RepID=A0A6A6KBZ3_HEVBR|nr:hypothetical protein GH714_008642 [Hevea brasiliensis]
MIAPKALRRIRVVAIAPLCANELGLGTGGVPHHGNDICRQRTGFRCLGPGCDATAKSVCRFETGSWEWIGGLESSTGHSGGLVCGQKFKVGLVQSVFFGGCMIGAGIFGHLSDSILGRKGSLTAVCMLNALFGCLTALAPDYWTYLLLRLLTGFSSGGVGLCAFVLATEPIGPTKRGTAGMSTFYFFSTGIAILSGVAYIFRSWRQLYIASSVPSILFLVTVLPFIAESPRCTSVEQVREETIGNWNTVVQWDILLDGKFDGKCWDMENHENDLWILGIFGMAGTYNLLFIYTAELFPTVVRNAALGCATQAAQMGAILAPFVVVFGGALPLRCLRYAELWEDCLHFACRRH